MQFRRPRNSGFRARRPRPRREWVASTSGWNDGITATSLTLGTVFAFPLVEAPSALTAAGDPSIDAFTVYTIIGDFTVSAIPQAAIGQCSLTLGIRVVDVNNGTPDVFDPTLGANAEESWQFLRYYLFDTSVAGNVGNTYSHLPNGNHIQVKSKRKLLPGQREVLFAKALAYTGTVGAPQFTLRLRALVGRAI